MAEEGSQLGSEDELQPADFLTSSLASLHFREEAVVNSESSNHMVDNPEPHSIFPVRMPSLLTQSKQQTDIFKATSPEPSPAVQGRGNGGIIFKH